jgi:hypothetical protein
MKNLEELEKKYAELGREIRVLKIEKNSETNYPIYCLSKVDSKIVKFTYLNRGIIVKQGIFYNVGKKYNRWVSHTNSEYWQQLDVCPDTGFYDGQLVWAWNEEDTHKRRLKFYDTENTSTYYYDGNRDGYVYDNYEPYEGNWPEWALKAFKTLER